MAESIRIINDSGTYIAHRARHANPKLLYEHQDTANLYHNVKSLQYTDYAEGSSDDLTVTLTDSRKNWFGGWFPEKGTDLDVYVDFYNWRREETLDIYHCGNFCVDDVTLSGGPRSITLRATSQPAASAFMETPVSKTWKSITVKQIATELMQKYGMTNLYFYGDETVIEEIEQSEQPDAEFLSSICEKYGFSLKIYKVGFVIYKKEIYEARGTVREFDGETEWEPDWEWNTTTAGTYTGARISYTNPKKGSEEDDIEITVGTEERLLILDERADSEAEAQTIAKNRVNKENEKAETLTFTTLFDPLLVASSNIQVKNLPHVEGKYFISKVVVKLDKEGLKMTVSAYKIQERLL